MSPAHNTGSSFFSLVVCSLAPKLHPHPKQEASNQTEAYGDQYLWLQAQPRSFKQGPEDGCTNGDSHGSQIGPYGNEEECSYPSRHEVSVGDNNYWSKGDS